MTDIELFRKIKFEIERRISTYTESIGVLNQAKVEELTSLLATIGEFRGDIDQKDLNSAADGWGKDMYCSCLEPYNGTGFCDGCSLIPEAFKDGARWAFKQGEIHRTVVMKGGLAGYPIVQHILDSFKPGDEVIIQVRKPEK